MRVSRTNCALSGWICASCERRLQANQTHLAPRRPNSTSTRKGKLPDKPARTRFAPSPTGYLHLGSIRTALFNYLLARRTGGQFLLRIEDTDQKRTIPGAEERLLKDLRWVGLQWDEGPVVGGFYGPYRQSERITSYRENVKPLLESGKAYRCFCSAERIKSFHEARHTRGLELGYDRKCADLAYDEAEDRARKGESHVIRFRAPTRYPVYHDLVYGKSGHGSKKYVCEEPVYDDQVLIKSDGFPTYHFANVVDDQLMKITHVVRGSEWMTSTPLHVALYDALGWTPPAYAHVPLLVDENKQKLSKRNLDTDIASFRNRGILPEALTNFTALLGWSHQLKDDVMDLRQLSEVFDLKITKGNTMVSFNKLKFLQQEHTIRRIKGGGEHFEQMIRDVAGALLERHGAGRVMAMIGKRQLRDVVASLLMGIKGKVYHENVAAIVEYAKPFFSDLPPLLSPPADALLPTYPIAASTLLLIPEEQWTADVIGANLSLIDLGVEGDPKTVKQTKSNLFVWLRWALLGGAEGAGIAGAMEILGREVCVRRIQAAGALCKVHSLRHMKPNVKYKPDTSGLGKGQGLDQPHPGVELPKVAQAA